MELVRCPAKLTLKLSRSHLVVDSITTNLLVVESKVFEPLPPPPPPPPPPLLQNQSRPLVARDGVFEPSLCRFCVRGSDYENYRSLVRSFVRSFVRSLAGRLASVSKVGGCKLILIPGPLAPAGLPVDRTAHLRDHHEYP